MSNAKVSGCFPRVGLGSDIHRLVHGEGIFLGSVFIPCAFACQAVSDGDVVLHALVDALLGACGSGDIGEWFPEKSVAPCQASTLFVLQAMAEIRAKGYAVGNVDCIIDLEPVRLSEWKGKIRSSLAAIMEIAPAQVNVKAKTGEGMGPVGEGKAVAAQVVVLLTPF